MGLGDQARGGIGLGGVEAGEGGWNKGRPGACLNGGGMRKGFWASGSPRRASGRTTQ